MSEGARMEESHVPPEPSPSTVPGDARLWLIVVAFGVLGLAWLAIVVLPIAVPVGRFLLVDDSLQAALEDRYRDQPEAFEEAAQLVTELAALHPEAERLSLTTGGVSIWDGLDYQHLELTASQAELAQTVRVDRDYTWTSTEWASEHDGRIVFRVGHETQPSGLIMHDPRGRDLAGATDWRGYSCAREIADGWCALEPPG